MKSAIATAICAIAGTLAVPSGLCAQDTNVPPEVKAFAAQYVAAYNSRDVARLESVYLPESRACVTPANRAVYDAVARMSMRNSVPANYLLSLMPVNGGNMKALASMMYFRVKPERELHIDYQYPNSNDGGQLVLWLVRQDGRWTADFPCMTEDRIKDFRDSAAAREHYKTVAAAIKEPLRSELLAMLRNHQSGEAAERYQKATGSDMRTSMLVINALDDEVQ
ncbi:MAG TPA: hypothetical protein VGS10_07415 [Terracidiphilus sp.]|nr:hypothetical protein [Terracidiphilus sp.]